MAYCKVRDGNQLMNPSFPNEETLPMEQPMTYFSCPKCNNKQLLPCKCRYVNYYCQCGWKHVNHPHDSSGDRGKDINHNAIMFKNIRS